MILLTDEVGEGVLGMVTIFCHPDQARIECCDALSALHQCGSLKPCMVVVRRYSNTPYIPRGTSCSLYLDVGTFSGGVASAQFPLDRLHLHWLLPFNGTDVLVPCEEGEERLGMYTHLSKVLWGNIEEECNLSDPIPLSVPLLAPTLLLEECTQMEGGFDSHPTSTQTAGGHSSQSSTGMWTSPGDTGISQKVQTQVSQTGQEACKVEGTDDQPNWCHLPEVLSQVSSTEAIKLLPWCVSAVVPFHYIGGAATMAAQHEGIPITSGPCPTAPEPEPSRTSPRSIWGSNSSTSDIPSTYAFLARYTPGRYSLVGASFCSPPSHSFGGKVGPLFQGFTQPFSC